MPVPVLLQKVQLLLNLAGELDGLAAVITVDSPEAGSDVQNASELLLAAGRTWIRHIAGQYLKHARDAGAELDLRTGQKSELHYGIVSPIASAEKLLEKPAVRTLAGNYAASALAHLEGIRAEALSYIGEHERYMQPIVSDPQIRGDLPIMFGDILAETA